MEKLINDSNSDIITAECREDEQKKLFAKTQSKVQIKAIFKDMVKYSPSKLFGLFGNLIVVPIYTNLLSPEQYGLYSISVAVLGFLCILFSDWVGLSGLRFFRQHELQSNIQKYVSTLIGLLAVNISIMFVFAFIFRHSFYDFFAIPPKLFMLILFLIIPVSIRSLLFQILRAQIKPSAFTVSTILNQIVTILVSIFVIKAFHLGGISILIGMAVSISLIDIVLIFQSNLVSYIKFEKPRFEILASLYKYGIPLSITSISLWFITQSNKFILQQIHGLGEVGLVGVAYSLTFPVLMTLFSIITTAAIPRIINLYEEKVDVRVIISKLTEYFILISLPIIVIMSIYPTELVFALSNAKFHKAAILLPYFAFATFFLSLADYTTLQYHLAKKTSIDTVIRVVSAGVGVLLNFLLIKKMGILGVGIATLAANFLYFLLSLIIVLPGLNWQVPIKRLSIMVLAFVPFSLLCCFFQLRVDKYFVAQIVLLLVLYYSFYSGMLCIFEAKSAKNR